MKRIAIIYGGREFSIGQQDFDRMKAEVEAAHRDGRSVWVRVNYGEGRPQPADLLVGPGIPIALLPIPDEPPTPADEADDAVSHGASDEPKAEVHSSLDPHLPSGTDRD